MDSVRDEEERSQITGQDGRMADTTVGSVLRPAVWLQLGRRRVLVDNSAIKDHSKSAWLAPEASSAPGSWGNEVSTTEHCPYVG